VLEKSAADAGAPELVAEKVSLPTSHKRFATAFVVLTDVPAAVATAGLDGSLVEALDEAIGSRHDVPAPGRGSMFRVLADATLVAGTFDRWDEVIAFEYRPRADAAPLRLYHSRGKHGWFDPKGHQPVRARWRMPLAFPRITSRFNPKRLHPILKVVMPHNGCDFAAPPGTPVYAIGPGVVTFRGDAGPSGNLVQIAHEGGIESGYAHLSRFAPGVVSGTHVEARTLVGYIGTTGRSTGPHLHLAVKRHGVFVDPLSLKMDAFRVVPPSERGGFAARKLEADLALDAIPLPKVELPVLAPAPSPSASASNGADGEPGAEGEEDEPPHH
jgi:murein DD-endopeptidase MepM/ murein hydrolase activator NlpD